MFISLRSALLVLSSTVVIACSGASGPETPEKSNDTGSNVPAPSGGDTKGGGTGAKPPSDPGSKPPPAGGEACAALAGSFDGPAEGKASLIGDVFDDEVSGKGKITLVPSGQAGSSDIEDGLFDVTIQAGVPIRVAMDVTGTVACDKLTAKLTGTAVGQGLHGDATCTMTAAGCKGEWKVLLDRDDKLVAKGTFDIAKK